MVAAVWSTERKGRPAAGPGEDVDEATRLVARRSDAANGTREQPPVVDAVTLSRTTWREELAAVGGRSPLLHFDDNPRTRIELSTTHPGGLPRFITGQTILLSNLIRDDLALRNARLAAGAVTDKAVELRSMRGLEAVHLAVGLASWADDGEEYCAPVLLRPLAIRRYGRDFELRLGAKLFVNPALTRLLRQRYGLQLDGAALVALANEDGVFKPQAVIDRLRHLGGMIPGFAVQPRLVVSSFLDVAPTMLDAVQSLDHPVLDAVAGDGRSARSLAEAFRPVMPVPYNERAPETDRLLLDSDPEQDGVVAQIISGNSVIVRTQPGTGGTQTVVNALGALVAAGQRILVVSPRRASLDSLTYRFDRIGLGGLAASARTLRRDLVEAIKRDEAATVPRMTEVDEALVRLRTVLLDYQRALVRPDPVLGVSVTDAVHALTRLSMVEHPPMTTVRLDSHALEALAFDRTAVAEQFAQAAELGHFRFGPGDSPWYGVEFATLEDSHAAYDLAYRLHDSELAALLRAAQELVGQTSLRPFESISELGLYLRLLQGVRHTLDRFVPSVFDRPLTELIAATAPRGDSEMSSANRRRLKAHAREYVRPGVHIADLHESLRAVQEQRLLWHRFTAVAGAVPQVPVGIAETMTVYQRVSEDLALLDRILGRSGTDASLLSIGVAELQEVLERLAARSDVLENIHERSRLTQRLGELHLAPLLRDLSERHVSAEHVGEELELAWWQSALERLLSSDKSLLSANTQVVERLESDFRLVDEAHAASNPQVLAAQLADRWRVAIVDWPEEAAALRTMLRQNLADIASIQAYAPHLLAVLSPVWLASPYEVGALPADLRFDAVFLLDAGTVTIAEAAPAILRARQVVAVGDPVIQDPARFEVAIPDPMTRPSREQEETAAQESELLHGRSALAQLGKVLPAISLTKSYRAGGADLTQLVNGTFYGGEIVSLPWAGTFLGRNSLSLDYVEAGQGLPDESTGAVESPEAEVARVVELVLRHATERPKETLMVVTASKTHAVRVQHAALEAFAKRPDLADFILADRSEPFAVTTIEQASAQSRDRVIFSVGFGRTPHDRVLSSFGSLAGPRGERALAVAMTRARRGVTIVSSVLPEHIDSERVGPGVRALAALMRSVLSPVQPESVPAVGDPLLMDLAERLRARGLQVEVDYGGQLPLVVAGSGRAVVVETDPNLRGRDLREALRLRPGVLRRLGWHYLRVHSFDLFSDPEAVAARIASLVNSEPGQTGVQPTIRGVRLGGEGFDGPDAAGAPSAGSSPHAEGAGRPPAESAQVG